MEKMIFKSCDAEVKVDDDGSIECYGSVFGNVDSDGDIIEPGAYTDTLEENGLPKMCSGHNWEAGTIGRWTHAEQDSKGLYLKGQFNLDQTGARDIWLAYKAQDMSGWSVGMMLNARDTARGHDGTRVIKRVANLVEVSAVIAPANPLAQTTVVKSIDGLLTLRDVEDNLRANGYSMRAAQTLISKMRTLVTNEQHDNEVRAIAESLQKLAGRPLLS